MALIVAIATTPALASGVDAPWVLRQLAQPVPSQTGFVELRGSALLKEPLRVEGQYRRPDAATLVRQVRAPYAETTTIADGKVSIARAGKPPRVFSLQRAAELADLQASFGALLSGELAALEQAYRLQASGSAQQWQLVLVPKAQALELIYNQPIVAERVLKRLAEKVRTASTYRTILSIPNAYQRVFALLNQFTKTAPGGLVVIEKMPTQQEIAITVNTSRETVSRAIQTLIQRGVVEKDLRRLIVRMPDALRNAIKRDPNGLPDQAVER